MKKKHYLLLFGFVFALLTFALYSRSTHKQTNFVHTLVQSLPAGKPTCCEHEWTIRYLHYHPAAVVPRRMYFASCKTKSKAPKLFASFSLGKNAKHPKPDPSSGAILESRYDEASGKLLPVGKTRHFPECVWMEGIAVSDDCRTIAALCRRKYGDRDYDVNALAKHPNKDWMTQPKCAKLSMWMYEWKNGDIHSKPKKILLHKAVDYSWEYGNNYLRMGSDKTYGVAIKSRVVDPRGQCHEADAFLVMKQGSYDMTRRGYYWACGTGHTTFNRPAFNPYTQKYAMLCGTDYSETRKSGQFTGFWFRPEGKASKEFGYTNNVGSIRSKGGTAKLLPLADGGFLGVVVGAPGRLRAESKYPKFPGTAIGLVRFSKRGKVKKKIKWIVKKRNTYLSYPQLTRLGKNRYLLGYGEMKRIKDGNDTNDESYRVPHTYYVREIDVDGRPLDKTKVVENAGWGEQDEMVSLGKGRVGWAYIPSPALQSGNTIPSCNSSSLQLSVYSSEAREVIEEEHIPDPPSNDDDSQEGGTTFHGDDNYTLEEEYCSSGKLIGLKWHYGMIVDRVRGICSNGKETGDLGSISGNGPKSFVCKGRGNSIQKLEAWAFGFHKSIDRLQITCKDGSSSGPVGGWDRKGKLQSPAISCPSGKTAVGIKGNQGAWLKGIGLLCR
ncbi:MAG: hypothetical protein AAF518_21950 [Spirochaetota bacterium]